MRALLLAAALTLPQAAVAHDPTLQMRHAPGYAWFVSPDSATHAQGRVRVVSQSGHGRAALTVNQTYAYQNAYRRHLARFARHTSLHRAEAQARHAAWHHVMSGAAGIRTDDLQLRPLAAGTLPLLPVR